MKLFEVIELEVKNLLFTEATRGSESFRQWYYPNLPKSYEINNEVEPMIEKLILQGKSAVQIAEIICSKVPC